MTDDIVDRLRRDLASGLSASIGDTEEAADEIERLREALLEIRRHNDSPGRTHFEIDRLVRAALARENIND